MKLLRKYKVIFILITINFKLNCQYIPGIEQTDLYFDKLKSKNIGILCNNNSQLRDKHLIDSLIIYGTKIKKIFAPEHGFYINQPDGKKIFNDKYKTIKKNYIPIISLYGDKYKPTPFDLEGIDIMLIDLQDVGVRCFTYISTVYYMLDACAQKQIPVILLDRANPNGHFIDGPVLDMKFASFVGVVPIPLVYGMTLGELVMMINGEHWLPSRDTCMLEVIKCKNYTHDSLIQLNFSPSPNLPNMASVYAYPHLVLFEGTNMSVGRGTDKPFLLLGSPDFCIEDTIFIPVSIPGKAIKPPFENMQCKGINLTNFSLHFLKYYRKIYMDLLLETYKCYNDKEKFFKLPFFDRLAGTDILRNQIVQGASINNIRASWKIDLESFMQIRQKYLLYEDFSKETMDY
ncbi:MAG: DUF1343 domain-containing protein [Bacteroidales bacterium]|jgi:uncharacterized protein YbbC (DUF1343 family)|nr:DUF1343 domain-containing protein [Bacteroidales bacterium]